MPPQDQQTSHYVFDPQALQDLSDPAKNPAPVPLPRALVGDQATTPDKPQVDPSKIIGTQQHTQAFIDAMPIPAEQKTAIWNGYYGSGSPSDYQKVVDGASLSAEQKTSLWHLKYNPGQLQTLAPDQPGMATNAAGAIKGFAAQYPGTSQALESTSNLVTGVLGIPFTSPMGAPAAGALIAMEDATREASGYGKGYRAAAIAGSQAGLDATSAEIQAARGSQTGVMGALVPGLVLGVVAPFTQEGKRLQGAKPRSDYDPNAPQYQEEVETPPAPQTPTDVAPLRPEGQRLLPASSGRDPMMAGLASEGDVSTPVSRNNIVQDAPVKSIDPVVEPVPAAAPQVERRGPDRTAQRLLPAAPAGAVEPTIQNLAAEINRLTQMRDDTTELPELRVHAGNQLKALQDQIANQIPTVETPRATAAPETTAPQVPIERRGPGRTVAWTGPDLMRQNLIATLSQDAADESLPPEARALAQHRIDDIKSYQMFDPAAEAVNREAPPTQQVLDIRAKAQEAMAATPSMAEPRLGPADVEQVRQIVAGTGVTVLEAYIQVVTQIKARQAPLDVTRPLVAPPVVPDSPIEGINALPESAQLQAKAVESGFKSRQATSVDPVDEPLRQVIEGAGGKWIGSDSSGLVHFDPPANAIQNVPEGFRASMALPRTAVTPQGIQDAIKAKNAQYAPKPQTIPAVYNGELPADLDMHFNKLAKLGNAMDNAMTDDKKASIAAKQTATTQLAQESARRLIYVMNPVQLIALRDHSKLEANNLQAQADAIIKRVNQHNQSIENVRAIRTKLAVGGPAHIGVVDEFGNRGLIAGGGAGRGPRQLLHEAMGEKPFTRAEDLIPKPKPAGMSEKDFHDRTEFLTNHRAALRAEISNNLEILKDTGNLGALNDPEHPLWEMFKDLQDTEGSLGKYPGAGEVGRKEKLPPQMGPNGEILGNHPLQTISLKDAEAMFGGRNLERIPDQTEFHQLAEYKKVLSALHKGLAAAAAKRLAELQPAPTPVAPAAPIAPKREGERGAVGSKPTPPITKTPNYDVSVSPKPGEKPNYPVPSGKSLLGRAKIMGIVAYKVDFNHPVGFSAIYYDGHSFNTGYLTHADMMDRLLPDNAKSGSALRDILNAGGIRVKNPRAFEVSDLTDKRTDEIEKMLIRSGNSGRDVLIDHVGPKGIQSITVLNDWENLKDGIAQSRKLGLTGESTGLRNDYFLGDNPPANLEAGKLGIRGPLVTGSMTIGGILAMGATALAGHAFAPFAPLAIGMGMAAGGMTLPILEKLGVKLPEWLNGPQADTPVNSRQKEIIAEQQRAAGSEPFNLVSRLVQLPGDLVHQIVGKLTFVNDRKNPLMKWMTAKDPRYNYARAVEAAGNTEADSPYIALHNAAGSSTGTRETTVLDYTRIVQGAAKAGVTNRLIERLNLAAYQRVYEVVRDKVIGLTKMMRDIQNKLQDQQLTPKDRVKLENQLEEARKERKGWLDKTGQSELVPKQYTMQQIAADRQKLIDSMTPKEQQAVEALAAQVFAKNAWALDFAHDNGLVSDEGYRTFTARGPEYIPMRRILQDMVDNTAKWQGKGSPFYLNTQHVIQALSGSELTNVNPIVASANANLTVIREAIRNRVVSSFIDSALADPKGQGKFIRQVDPSERPTPGFTHVGRYVQGKPETWEVPNEVAAALQGGTPLANDTVQDIVAKKFGSMLRTGAIMGNLGYALMRIFRDADTSLTQSKAGLPVSPKAFGDLGRFMTRWGSNLVSALKKDARWREAMDSGALLGTIQRALSPDGMVTMQDLGLEKKLGMTTYVDTISELNKALESAGRMTTFQKLRQMGLDTQAAAYHTRMYGGTPDVANAGAASEHIGYLTMFVNAEIKNLERNVLWGINNPARAVMYLGAMTTLLLTVGAWNHSMIDSKGVHLIDRVSDYDRDHNIVVLTPWVYKKNGVEYAYSFKVPKNKFTELVANPIEESIDRAMGTRKISTPQQLLNEVSRSIPGQFQLQPGHVAAGIGRGVVGSLNPVLKIPIEEALNQRMFGTGSPIVPSREQGALPEEQYGPNTSPTAVKIGQGGWKGASAGAVAGGAIGGMFEGPIGAGVGAASGALAGGIGVSPERIQHVVGGLTGGVGDLAMGAVAPVVGAQRPTGLTGAEAVKATPVAGPVAGRFMASPVDQPMIALEQKYYDSNQKVMAPFINYQALEKMDPVRARDYKAANGELIWYGQALSTAEKSLGEINKAILNITTDQTMSPQDKNEALSNLHDQKMAYLQQMTEVIRLAENQTKGIKATPSNGVPIR